LTIPPFSGEGGTEMSLVDSPELWMWRPFHSGPLHFLNQECQLSLDNEWCWLPQPGLPKGGLPLPCPPPSRSPLSQGLPSRATSSPAMPSTSVTTLDQHSPCHVPNSSHDYQPIGHHLVQYCPAPGEQDTTCPAGRGLSLDMPTSQVAPAPRGLRFPPARQRMLHNRRGHPSVRPPTQPTPPPPLARLWLAHPLSSSAGVPTSPLY
jgi:hypothetical protein